MILIIALITVSILTTGLQDVTQQSLDSSASLRGLSVVSDEVAWLSGAQGTVGRTTDGGKTWQVIKVPGAEKLDFRDVEAFDDKRAFLLSIGPGELSRIYYTADGGATWKQQWKNDDKNAFYDAIAFWDAQHGIALSDPVNGKYRLLTTNDGETWKILEPETMPAILKGEGAFAASGTCLITVGKNDVYFVTGGAKVARVFHSKDRGKNWTATETPIQAGKESSGIFSIAFRDDQQGIIVGGDYQQPKQTQATVAITNDAGKTWKLIEQPLPFLSAVTWANGRWIAAGTAGIYTSTNGTTWKQLGEHNCNAVRLSQQGTGWAVGPQGKVFRISQK